MTADGKAAKALRGVGYVLFFVMCVLFFIVATFPDEAARNWAQVQGSNILGTPVQIEEAALTGLVGIDADGIVIRLKKLDEDKLAAPAGDPKNGEEPVKKKHPPPRLIEINKVEITASPFSLLFSDLIEFDFRGEVQGGTISKGKLSIDSVKQTKRIQVGEIDNVTLGAERFLLGLIGLDVRAAIGGTIDLTMGPTAAKIQGGTIDLTFEGTVVLKPSFEHKTMGRIGLTDVEIGVLRLRAVVKPLTELPGYMARRARKNKDSMVIHIEELSSESDEFAFKTEEKSAIHFSPDKPISEATVDLHFAVFVKKALLEKRGKNHEGVDGEHNSIISKAAKLRLIPTLARVYRKGIFGVICTGKLSKPNCRFKRTKVRFDEDKDSTSAGTPVSKRSTKRDRVRPGAKKRPALRKNAKRGSSATSDRARNTSPKAVTPRDSRGSASRIDTPRVDRIRPSTVERPVRPSSARGRVNIPTLTSTVPSSIRKGAPLEEPTVSPEGGEEVSPYEDEPASDEGGDDGEESMDDEEDDETSESDDEAEESEDDEGEDE